MSNKTRRWLVAGGALLLVVTVAAFFLLDFRVAGSRSEVNVGMSTYRTGETLPHTMGSGFALAFTVTGDDPLTVALPEPLQTALVEETRAGTVMPVAAVPEDTQAPFLLVEIHTDELLWTPVYGRAQVTAVVYYDHDGDVPWPRDEAVVMRESPAIQADGEFTLVDMTRGLFSRPAYIDQLSQELAQAIAMQLQQDVFTRP